MRCLRGDVFAAAAVLFAAASAARCQTYLLAEAGQAGDCFHVTLDMKLAGEIRVRKGDDAAKLKLAASAVHEYPERVLAGADGLAQKAARVYDTAKATIHVNGDASERTLRPERRLVVAQRDKDQLLVYSTGGALHAGRTGTGRTTTSTRWRCRACCRARRSRSATPGRCPNAVAQAAVQLRGPDRADADRQAGGGQRRRRASSRSAARRTASTRARW